jgi:autoinducer 2-binding protein LuxP
MYSYFFKSTVALSIVCTLIFPTDVNASGLENKKLISPIVDREKLKQFQITVNAKPVPISTAIAEPIRIAVIYPSNDISDFWIRNYTAMTKRLEELGLPFVIKQYPSKQIEHSLQTQHTNTVLNEGYDFVVFGPSELAVQSKNIQKLAASKKFKTYIWAFHTPDSSWEHQPDAWFDFSSAMGAEVLCNYVLKRLGDNIEFAANRGIPGITDTQRSQGFIDCVEEKGNWLSLYEHFGQYQKLGGADGAKLFLDNFSEVKMIHNANTAMTMGAIDTLKDENKLSDIFVTGWGGTAKEVEKIKRGEINATPMRMSDDLGVATAESIKFSLENRQNEIPLLYLGRILVVHNEMSNEVLDTHSREAFRYSGED